MGENGNHNGGLPFLTLYNRRVSYYCQMVRLAMVEKGFPFQTIDVDYLQGQTYEPDFVRLNPACEIPVLKVGSPPEETVICGSQEIIDYLDRFAHRGTDAEARPAVDAFRRRCMTVPVSEISLGVTRDAHLLELADFSQMFRTRLASRVNRVSVINEKIAAHPELREAYQQKLARVLHSEDQISTPARLRGLLDGLVLFLDEVDLLLRNNSNGNPLPQQGESWLFGAEFTNADMILACILARVDLLGLAGKYWDETERIFLADYYRRLKKRPSFMQQCVPHSSFA
ncbi:putative Ganglioside-induced differentiation-associated protein 1 [Hypsibius exemplaris]|uniref:Ganglioside-induced differentiation-associated protein 1 n=1 Tax=Hypsibius exemplaris TaxID=2072580 RepID=A0A1W0WQ21_HYPEX|nr:putative Ganglioside-induced differentiation-associated protein 1 [Hypsibius exemplaris]